MVAIANLRKEQNDFLNSAQTDVDDEENTEEETENVGDERTAPPTSTASLSVPEAATHDSTNASMPDNVCSSFSYRQPAQYQ
ncbi:hypothetical protein PoB_006178400 [Plakobranchus ocellatus]|uniref:Uncharacterized protein n=1 Tax=Plakobranchus ocellatus TaxID=259542 RepID=A0AAV4CTS4_9GAST|nr:hypothetical protein PoB_006178400 [Plakobranchus ocellatus]